MKKKIETKIKTVPGRLISPKTAFNSLSRNSLIFKIVFLSWELINQNIWGKKKIEIKIDSQFNIILREKIFTVGSKEENKFIIF
jgi:hypothetical protein